MRAKDAKRLVIDADVARSIPNVAGDYHPCRTFLEAMRTSDYGVVMTPKLSDEWKRNSSRFSSRWLSAMQRRGRVHVAKGDAYASLDDQIQACTAGVAQKAGMTKDSHLIAAAVETDRRVVSLDETARSLFQKHSDTLERLRDVVWVNPNKADETPIEWLEAGAPADAHRMLGSAH